MDDKRLEQLEQDLADLRKDFGAISDTLKDLADKREDAVHSGTRSSYRVVCDKGQTFCRDIREHGPGYYACARVWAGARFKQSKDKIRANPGSAAAILIGIGIVIGLLLGN